MKKIKLISLVVVIVCVVITTQLSISAAGESYSWYCMRNKNHLQPRCEANMSFIEHYNGYYVDRRHGDDCADKVVYLTFDAGYENGNIARILDVLNQKKVKAAFFILSNLPKSSTDLVKRMAAEGHTLCNHTASHKDMSSVSDKEAFAAELSGLEQVCREYTGLEVAHFYRPPEGRFSEQNLKAASELGYKTIFWSFAYADWDNNKQPSPDYAKKLILDNIHNGAILLLHPTSATNAQILPEVIDTLRQQGYRFGTLEEMTAQ